MGGGGRGEDGGVRTQRGTRLAMCTRNVLRKISQFQHNTSSDLQATPSHVTPRQSTSSHVSPRQATSRSTAAARNTRTVTRAFVMRDSLKPHVSTTSTFSVQHPCFEAAQLNLTYNKQLTNFCIYRPPPSKKNQFSDSMFSISFPTFLNALTVCLVKHFLWVTLIFILET